MEHEPRLEHRADSIRMADDFSKQDNSGIYGGHLPDPEMATAVTAHERPKPRRLSEGVDGGSAARIL
jgi:hypothetical protein